MKLIRRLKALLRKRKAERKLKKSGCSSWSNYKHNHDPAVFVYANDVESFYKGYKYVYAFEQYEHFVYQKVADYGPGGCRYGYDEMTDWCEKKHTLGLS